VEAGFGVTTVHVGRVPSPVQQPLRTLFRSYCVKRRRLLFYVFAAAVRTSDLAFIVLMQREGLFEVLAAIVAVIIVHGHKIPPSVKFREILRRDEELGSCELLFL